MADREYLRIMFRYIVLGLLGIILLLILSYFGNNKSPLPSVLLPSNTSTSSNSITSSTTSTPLNPVSNPNQGSVSAITPLGNYGNFNFLILILLIVVFFLVILVSRFYRQNFKRITISKPEKKQEKIQYDQLKLSVINEYLKLSKILEEKGINPDFSLTPVEFDSETNSNLQLSEFKTITYYYELARFSADSLSSKDIGIFKEQVKAVYDKIKRIEKIEKHPT